MSKLSRFTLPAILIACLAWPAAADSDSAGWRDSSHRAVLKNDRLEARFQSGRLFELSDVTTGKTLLSTDPSSLSANIPLFGATGVDLDDGKISWKHKEGSIDFQFAGADGTEWNVHWTLEPGDGDLVLRTSARTPKPVGRFSVMFPGCDISEHRVVWISVYGAGHVQSAPWTGSLGDVHNGISQSYIQPIVSLFEGDGAGWFLEGREEKIGPANVLLQGRGETVDATLVRGFPVETTTPEMFEIRLRAYSEHWEDAVDPYVEWMERSAGFVPLDKKRPKWVNDIEAQAYVRIGDFKELDKLATRLDPERTMIGRMVGWRLDPMDLNYPDYRVNETAKRWIKRARELGFHVGVHFNTSGVSKDNAELLKRFERGFNVTGVDEEGNKTYSEIPGAGRHRYCSTALKDWRDYLIEQMREAVDVGVDLIYIDESMAGTGAFMVDGMTAIEGVMTLEKEIMEAYPHVAVETEQFNPMASRHAAFALSQMPLGHPLSGYIFHRFIHILPEGYTIAPVNVDMMDAVQSWGFMVPGGAFRESWIQICEAFQQYGLVPDSRLPRTPFTKFADHHSHGIAPVADEPVPPEGIKLFGFRGRKGVTAFYEKHPTRRGLVIYQPGKDPQWIGTRITGVKTWTGPGAVEEITPGVNEVADWMYYDGDKIFGLDPERTYALDESKSLSPDRFHFTAIPDDFSTPMDGVGPTRTVAVGQGQDRSFYKMNFSGHGEIRMHVPDDTLVFLDGREVVVDRGGQSAVATIDASEDEIATLIAFRKSDVELSGEFADLPVYTSLQQRNFYFGQHQVLDYSTEGPVRKMRDMNAFYAHLTGTGVLIGRLPDAGSIRIQGAYGMREESIITDGDAVIRINGNEVMRMPPGPRPYEVHSFKVDISAHAGRHVMLEFLPDGLVHGPSAADWFNPRIVVNERGEGVVPTDQLEILENR